MINYAKRQSVKLSAMVMAGMMAGSMDAYAAGNNLANITTNIGNSAQTLPGLVSGTSYILGTVIGTLGILKIKDHVENPPGTPLKEGAIRLLAGGALLTMPTILDVMQTTIDGGTQTETDALDTQVETAMGQFSHAEQVKKVHLLDHDWEPDTACLTATSKLRRRVIEKTYASEIEAMYS